MMTVSYSDSSMQPPSAIRRWLTLPGAPGHVADGSLHAEIVRAGEHPPARCLAPAAGRPALWTVLFFLITCLLGLDIDLGLSQLGQFLVGQLLFFQRH